MNFYDYRRFFPPLSLFPPLSPIIIRFMFAAKLRISNRKRDYHAASVAKPALIETRAWLARLESTESPLARGGRERVVQEDNLGKCGEGFPKGSVTFLNQKEANEDSVIQDGDEFLQDEATRKREQALRQHAFFQLRLHIRRGTNLVAMDRCGTKFQISFFFSDLCFAKLHFLNIFLNNTTSSSSNVIKF